MILREAQAADLDALARIAAEAYCRDFAEILEPQALEQRGVDFFLAHLGAALAELQVAQSDDRILGFSKVTKRHLDMLFVASEARGSGAGSALLQRAEAKGVCTLESFRDNHAARSFYERRGWRLSSSYEREFLGGMRCFVQYSKP